MYSHSLYMTNSAIRTVMKIINECLNEQCKHPCKEDVSDYIFSTYKTPSAGL